MLETLQDFLDCAWVWQRDVGTDPADCSGRSVFGDETSSIAERLTERTRYEA